MTSDDKFVIVASYDIDTILVVMFRHNQIISHSRFILNLVFHSYEEILFCCACTHPIQTLKKLGVDGCHRCCLLIHF